MAGLLAGTAELLQAARASLENEWGPVALATRARPWTESRYYEAEMGPALLRQFLGFANPVTVDRLASLKRRAIDIENTFRPGAARPRTVNIDPGLVNIGNLTLASTKQAGHRVWIGDGIWAEITLVLREGAFQPLPWTYPDFRLPETLEFLSALRRLSLPKINVK